MDAFLQRAKKLAMLPRLQFQLRKVTATLSVLGNVPVISAVGYRSFHSCNGISRTSSIAPCLKPVHLLSSVGLGRLLHSSESKDIDRELIQSVDGVNL